jgi:hypothetical protein
MRKVFLMGLLLLCNKVILAQHTLIAGGSRSQAMCDASATVSDVFAAFNNQACLTQLIAPEAGMAVQNKFALKELSTLSAAFALPLKNNKGVFALSIGRYGYKLFNQNKVGLAYAKQLSQVFSAGVQVDYLNTHIAEGYGSRSSFTVEGGVLASLGKLKAGFQVFNPVNVKLADYNDERIPVIVKLGMSYTFSDKLLASAELNKVINRSEIIKIAIEYHPVNALYIRAGVRTDPVQFTFGFGFKFQNFYADLSSGYYEPLGYQPGLSLRYAF